MQSVLKIVTSSPVSACQTATLPVGLNNDVKASLIWFNAGRKCLASSTTTSLKGRCPTSRANGVGCEVNTRSLSGNSSAVDKQARLFCLDVCNEGGAEYDVVGTEYVGGADPGRLKGGVWQPGVFSPEGARETRGDIQFGVLAPDGIGEARGDIRVGVGFFGGCGRR
mmetsp:Transcript_20738/g.29207  ORF Transcript_20738/g.29207 Transcript_20738/m.29207 type:complete len:167 (-) Transcript_20738:328-828(-)